ncbi:MAG: porin [Alcaligenaceae bacterium]|nr:MAG: porin [Alcaligenaceae bacterium]
MKKSLVALAALAVAGVASAQSSVTLFGVVDASISNYSTKSNYYNNAPALIPGTVQAPYLFPDGVVRFVATPGYVVNPNALSGNLQPAFARKQSQTVLANSAYNSSRIGFRGTEDLGGGLAASFWLETGINNDDGSKGINNFNRRSTVSLSGGFGEIRLGRDYTPTFWNDTVFDPFGTNGVGTNLISVISGNLAVARGPGSGVAGSDNYVRTGNSIGYFLPPNLGGFYGQVQYALHENVKSSDGYLGNSTLASSVYQTTPLSTKGRYAGARFGYANGPLDVAVAYGQSTATDSQNSVQELGFASVGAPFATTTSEAFNSYTSTKRKLNTMNLGASYDFGPVKLFGELSQVRDKYSTGASATESVVVAAPFVPAVSAAGGAGSARSYTDKYSGWLVGVTAPVGAGLIRAAYSRVKYSNDQVPSNGISYTYPPVAVALANNQSLFGGNANRDASADKWAIGYVHNLSKRTALYATYSRTSMKNAYNNPIMGATAGGAPAFLSGASYNTNGYSAKTATGYDFGIRHAF